MKERSVERIGFDPSRIRQQLLPSIENAHETTTDVELQRVSVRDTDMSRPLEQKVLPFEESPVQSLEREEHESEETEIVAPTIMNLEIPETPRKISAFHPERMLSFLEFRPSDATTVSDDCKGLSLVKSHLVSPKSDFFSSHCLWMTSKIIFTQLKLIDTKRKPNEAFANSNLWRASHRSE